MSHNSSFDGIFFLFFIIPSHPGTIHLSVEETWREQKEFVLLKQIYIAATTYGENSSACIQGAWSQIISSIKEISSEIVAQYDRYLEEEQKQEEQGIAITEENITPFVGIHSGERFKKQ